MLVKEAQEGGARKHKACEVLSLSVRTLERWEKHDGKEDKRKNADRPAPANQLTKEEQKMLIDVANSEAYRDLPPSKIVPLLADEGRYIASESTFYRELRKLKQLRHRQHSKAAQHHKPKPFVAMDANQLWSWDITYLPTTIKGLYFYLYAVMDVYSRKIVGWGIHERQSADLGSALVKQACLDEAVDQGQLVLHSDNGKPMKGSTMLAILEALGVMPSFSRPSVSDDNQFSESLFKTIKYHPTVPYVDRFDTLEDARAWMERFSRWYNTEHLHSGIKFVTPHQRHTGEDKIILEKRHQVYQLAKKQRPERWSGSTRDWSRPANVLLNPGKKPKDNKDAVPDQILGTA